MSGISAMQIPSQRTLAENVTKNAAFYLSSYRDLETGLNLHTENNK
jgi:hypothetical protein